MKFCCRSLISVVPIVMLGCSLLLAGCANTPARDADLGNPYPLMKLVMTGQINPNDPLPARSGVTVTPLCALLNYLTAAPAVDILLEKGADVNKPCRTRSGGYEPWEGTTPDLPLDIVIDEAIDRGRMPSPYTANPRYRQQDLPALYVYAEKLIQRGGKSKTGAVSLAQIKQKVSKGIDFGNEIVAQQKEKLAEEKSNSILNIETLGAAIAIVGAAADNYAAQSNQQTLHTNRSALPLAQIQPIPSDSQSRLKAESQRAADAERATEKRNAARTARPSSALQNVESISQNIKTTSQSVSTNATGTQVRIKAESQRAADTGNASSAFQKKENIYQPSQPTENSSMSSVNSARDTSRKLHEVEDDWSPYEKWVVIARGDHMVSREASCNEGKRRVERHLATVKGATDGLVNQSPCICTKWWDDEPNLSVRGKWNCAILGHYTGKAVAVER